MRHSLEAADALRGYASGMSLSRILLTPCGGCLPRRSRSCPTTGQTSISLWAWARPAPGGLFLAASDEICAMELARGLAGCEKRSSPACTSCRDARSQLLCQGEASDPPRRCGELRRLLTGERIGGLCSGALVPPLVQDFEAQCRTFRLRLEGPQRGRRCGTSFPPRATGRPAAFFTGPCSSGAALRSA
ncbi:MAG: DUF5682 family protein [Oscillospiraceae bacterium]